MAGKLKGLVDAALELTRVEKHFLRCKCCRKESWFEVPVRDVKGSVKALSELLDQAHGKPAETRAVTVDVNVRREELASMSDAQLLELAAAEPAEWQELGPS
jgi:hypothetical protein